MPPQSLHWQNLSAGALASTPDLLSEWDRLNEERINLPFLTSAAVSSALQVFGSGTERLLIGRIDGTLVAMLIVVPDGPFKWLTFQPSQLPLGVWVAERSLPVADIASSLIRGSLGLCLVFSITQIDPLMALQAPDNSVTKHSIYIETGWIDIIGTFGEYWAGRGKNLRQNMRKQRNKLAADGIHTHMRALTSPDDMAGAITRYGMLESSGWKAADGTAIHPDNPQGQFYIQLLKNAAQQGEAIVYEYFFNEKIVAINLCMRRLEKIVVLKTTYDENIKNFSPAFLLSHDVLEQIFEQGQIKRLEYYGRMMEWHTRWTENKRTLYHFTCFRWGWLKKLTKFRHNDKTEHSILNSDISNSVFSVKPVGLENNP